MLKLTRHNLIFLALLVIDFFILVFAADSFDISYKESLIYYEQSTLLSKLIHISTAIFGQNNIALRTPFILFYIASVIILYLLTEGYFKREIDRLFSIVIFMLLPGVNGAALLVNEASMVIFFTLLYLYLFKLTNKEHYWLLVICLFIDNSFAIMYLALFFYSLKKRDNLLLIVSLVLFGISMQMYGFDTGGKPRGYFIDTFRIYTSIFSPIIFLYFFYAIYRVTIKEEKDLYWYISFTAFAFSLILSLRQSIKIDDFAPFVVIAIPMMVKLFMQSFRVRLPQFRKKHYGFAIFGIATLIISFLLLIINKPLYLLIYRPSKHFAIKYHFVSDLAQYFHKHNINKVLCEDYRIQSRLKFYGINEGKDYYITSRRNSSYKQIPIKYMGKTIYSFYIQKF